MLTFEESTHTYTDDGVVLPSVTHIIRFLSVDIAANAKPWLRDVAADRGTRIHAYCADIDFGAEPESIDWDCAGYVAAYKSFLRDYRPKWTQVEYMLGSKEIGFAGTIDRIGYINGALTIPDLKTGARISKPSLTAQLTGYSDLCVRLGIVDCRPALLGLQLKKDGKYSLIPCEHDRELWLACMTLNSRLEK